MGVCIISTPRYVRISIQILYKTLFAFGKVGMTTILLFLQRINLYGNNLTSVDDVLHKGMWNLVYLNVGGNTEMTITQLTFKYSMTSLSELHISNNEYNKVDPNLLKNLWKLKKLYFNGNDLTEIPRYFFEHNYFLTDLQLSNNRLTSVEQSMMSRREWHNMMKLKLDGNELKTVAFGKRKLLISHLDISRNQISEIRVRTKCGFV